jgi:hypothetical protein
MYLHKLVKVQHHTTNNRTQYYSHGNQVIALIFLQKQKLDESKQIYQEMIIIIVSYKGQLFHLPQITQQ